MLGQDIFEIQNADSPTPNGAFPYIIIGMTVAGCQESAKVLKHVMYLASH